MSESSSGKHRRLLVVPRDVSGLYPLPQRERTRRFALDAGIEDATPSPPRRRERTLLFVAPLAEKSVVQPRRPVQPVQHDVAPQQIEDADIVDDDPTPRDDEMLQRLDVAPSTSTARTPRRPSGEGTFVLPRARHRRARLEALAAQEQGRDQSPGPRRATQPRVHRRVTGVRRWHVAILVGAALVLLGTLLMPMGTPPVDVEAAERTQRVRARLELMELLDRDALAAAVTPSPLDAALARLDDIDDIDVVESEERDDVEPRIGTNDERRKSRASRAVVAPALAPAAVAPRALAGLADPADGARVAPVARPAPAPARAPRADGFARVRTGAGFGGSR